MAVDTFMAYVGVYPDEAAERYAALGVTELEVMPDRHPVEFATEIAEKVAPRVAAIG